MARITDYGISGGGRSDQDSQKNVEIISADQQGPVEVPNEAFIRDAEITREGQDLVLESPDGAVIVIEGYFNADPAPMITSPDGAALTPKLVSNFVQDEGAVQYARADSVIDESAVGEVLEITGQATVVRTDGSTEPLTIGTPIYQGDIIETAEEGAVNIQFIDESTFAVSENARLAIDEYVFDPQSESGSTNFSVLRGIFVFTSGLIGRDDPDDVQIDTPVGSIGIRGTTIMGNVDTGEITVVEGAIVMRSYDGKEMTLDEQFETGKFDPASGEVLDMGIRSADDMSQNFDSVSGVVPALFSGFESSNDADQASDTEQASASGDTETTQQAGGEENTEQPPQEQPPEGETELASLDGEQQTTQDSTETASGDDTADGEATETASGGESNTDGETTDGNQPPADEEPILLADGDTGLENLDSTTGSLSPTGSQPPPSGTSTSGGTAGTTTSGGTAGTTTSTTSTEPPPPLPLDLVINRTAVEDSIADGQVIAVVSTTNSFSGIQYQLNDDMGGTIGLFNGPNGSAAIRLVSGPLTAGTPLDISVTATLPDGRTTTESYNINVVDTNNAPTVADNTFAIDEDANINDVVGNVGATDPDAGDTLSYSIIGGDPLGQFSIDASGNVVLNGTLDFEAQNSYTLTVRVRDDGFGTLADTATITVNLNDINDAPVLNNPGSAFTISEGAMGGTTVADASTFASDQDAVDTLSYAITGGNTGSMFAINATTGQITLMGTLDYEDIQSYSLIIEVTDDGTGALTDTAMFNIDVTNVLDDVNNYTGTAGDDNYASEGGNDTLNGAGGNDTLAGGAGDDTIFGGAGADVLYGDDGNDTIDGGSEDDTIYGGAGDDTIDGGAGNDTLNGGMGNDTFVLNNTDGNDTINGGGGYDTYDASAITGSPLTFDLINGQVTGAGGTDSISGIERFIGGASNDTFISDGGSYEFIGGAGADVFEVNDQYNINVDGGTGSDTLTFAADGTYNFVNFTNYAGIQTYNVDTGVDANISVDLGSAMFSETNTITFDLSNNTLNDLDIDFSGFSSGWHVVSGNLTGGGTVTFEDTTATYNVVINYASGGEGNIAVTGATLPDTTAPVLNAGIGIKESGLSGAVAIDSDIKLHFDEDIYAGTGNITIRRSSDDSILDTLSVGSGNVTISGNSLKINPSVLLETGTQYYIEIDNGAIEDLNTNSQLYTSDNFTANDRTTFMSTVGGLGTDAAQETLELMSGGLSDGYIVVGQGERGSQHDITITQYDHHGFVEDVTTIGDGSGSEFAAGIAHNGSGVFIGGTTDGGPAAGANDFMLSSLDASGGVNWTRVYGTAVDETLSDVASYGSSQVLMAGTVGTGDTSARVIQIDGTNGNVLWENDLSQASIGLTAEFVMAYSYGGDVLVGGTNSANGGDMMIARLDGANGGHLWSYNIDVSGGLEQFGAMTEIAGGDIIVAGETDYNDPGYSKGLLMRLATDISGDNPTVAWAVSIGQNTSYESISDVIELNGGDIAVTGKMGAMGDQAFVAVFDTAGVMQWAKSLYYSGESALINSIEETNDGSLLISGYTTADTAGGSQDAFTVLMSSSGDIQDSSGALISSGALGGGWTLNDVTGSIGTADESANVTVTENTGNIGTIDPDVANNSWALNEEDGSDIDHQNDILGDTDGTANGVGTNAGESPDYTGQDGTFSGMGGNDTIDIDGFDVVNGGSGDDTVRFFGSDDGAVIHLGAELGYIDGGTGNDTFSLMTDNDLDLSALAQDGNALSGIERINLLDPSTNAQTVKLTYDAIIGMTDDNNVLIIDGGAGDSVEADLTSAGFSAVDSGGGAQGAGYEYYTNGTVDLYIQDAVDQANVAV